MKTDHLSEPSAHHGMSWYRERYPDCGSLEVHVLRGDHNWQALAYVYFDEKPRPRWAKLLTKDEARRIAAYLLARDGSLAAGRGGGDYQETTSNNCLDQSAASRTQPVFCAA
jgi:hypothetical protein